MRAVSSLVRTSAILAIVLVAPRARAQVPADAARWVEVVVAADSVDRGRALQSAIEQSLARAHVDVRTQQVSTFSPLDPVTPHRALRNPLARIWIGARQPGTARLFLVDGRWERILLRRIPIPNGLDEVAREAVGQFVEDGVDALLCGARLGISREQALAALDVLPSRTDTAPEHSSIPRLGHVDLSVGYQAESFADNVPFVHGPGAAAGVFAHAGRFRLGLVASGQYRVPSVADLGWAMLSMQQLALRLMPTLESAINRRLFVLVAAGGGTDVVWLDPQFRNAAFVSGPTTTTMLPVVRAVAGVRVSVAPHVSLQGTLGCDVDVLRAYYYVQDGSQQDVLVSPRGVRPVGELAVTFGDFDHL